MDSRSAPEAADVDGVLEAAPAAAVWDVRGAALGAAGGSVEEEEG